MGMDANLVSKIQCENANITANKIMFNHYGINCNGREEDTEFIYMENMLYIDLLKSDVTCKKHKC